MTGDKEIYPAADSDVQNVRGHSMRKAGLLYLVGDAALFVSGMMSGRYKEAFAGAAWGVGGLVPARYGAMPAERRLRELYHGMGEYLTRQGVTIPEGSALDATKLADSGIIERVETFLYHHPSQVLNAIYALGGTSLAESGFRHNKPWDTASGLLVTAGGLGGLLVPEKPKPKVPEGNVFARSWSWIADKPLRISSTLYSLNNATLAYSAYKEWQTDPKQYSYLFKVLTAASYFVANMYLGVSSKSHARQNGVAPEVFSELENEAARVIAAQPAGVQANLLEQVSGYIASQPGAIHTASAIAEGMRSRINGLAGKAQATDWAGRLAGSAAVPSPAL